MKLTCPQRSCRAENDARNEVCVNCQTPLQGYALLATYPDLLFNRGLSLARANHLTQARDLFAAVVYWCPNDVEARNALAMACFALGDRSQAQRQWERVLKDSPADALAKQGIGALELQAIQAFQEPQIPQQPAAQPIPARPQSTRQTGFFPKKNRLMHTNGSTKKNGGAKKKH